MNFFGLPVGVLDLLIALYLLLAVLLSVGVVMISVKRHPVGNRSFLGRLVSLFNKAADALRSRLPITAMEGYKQLIFGGTALFLIAAVWIAPRLNYIGYSDNSTEDPLYSLYLREASGPIGEGTYAYIERAKANLEIYEELGDFEAALAKLESRVELRKAMAEEEGYEPWLLDQTALNETFGEDSFSIHRWNAIVSSALVILIASPIFALEKRCGTEKLLHSSVRGRGYVYLRKYLIVLIGVVAVFAIVYTRQIIREVRFVGVDKLSAPIQNADMLAGSRLRITLGAFIAAGFCLRFLSLAAVGLFTAFISQRSQSWEKAALTAAALILVPGVLYYFGREWAGFVSIIPGVSAFDLLVPSKSSSALAAVTALLIAASAALTAIGYARSSKRAR